MVSYVGGPHSSIQLNTLRVSREEEMWACQMSDKSANREELQIYIMHETNNLNGSIHRPKRRQFIFNYLNISDKTKKRALISYKFNINSNLRNIEILMHSFVSSLFLVAFPYRLRKDQVYSLNYIIKYFYYVLFLPIPSPF
jgi:hypothetical protein